MNMDNAISPDYDQSPQLSEGGAVVVFVFAFLGLFLVVVASCSAPNVPKTESNGDSPSAIAGPAVVDTAAAPIQIIIQRDALPQCTFYQLKDAAAASSCAICLADYNGVEAVRVLPECCHVFHRSCIDPWLKINATCPACRNPTPTPLPEAAAQ